MFLPCVFGGHWGALQCGPPMACCFVCSAFRSPPAGPIVPHPEEIATPPRYRAWGKQRSQSLDLDRKSKRIQVPVSEPGKV